jgi:hypothetical protein
VLFPQALPAARRLLVFIEVSQGSDQAAAGSHGGEGAGERRFPDATLAAYKRDYDCHCVPAVSEAPSSPLGTPVAYG